MSPRIPVYISLGSNIDPAANLPAAVKALRQAVEVVTVASTWETPPYGTSGENFYNTVLYAQTDHSLTALKNDVLRPIESMLGRVRTADKYAPRPIDLDILLYDGRVVEPRLWTLSFLTVPLAELLPELRNAVTKQTLAEAARQMRMTNHIVLRPGIINNSLDEAPSKPLH